jgi:alkylhydroperoxidase family enzyme
VARLGAVDVHALPWTTRFQLWLQRRVFGRVLGPYPVIARAPRVVTMFTFANALFSTGQWAIGADLRTLIHLRVAQIVGCVF